ncbi:TlpA family protein disulfide reductase [Aquibacillus kalidii]|uniref:TlpA family protein disulfide reductase n=1 Tax=Aquibacillus kalidii TaxID=2762597 RepID=UPI001647583D|nr:TlpA disulfide reductase family protein [Aquibacillus kalidii]
MRAPLFKLPYINNQQQFYHLQDDIGKIIIITFWTSWCPDCGTDLPRKEQLNKTINNPNVKMLTINVTGREREEKAGANFADRFLTQPTLSDNGKEIYNLYQCMGVPTTVIIAPDGTIVDQFGDQASFNDVLLSIGKLLEKSTKS